MGSLSGAKGLELPAAPGLTQAWGMDAGMQGLSAALSLGPSSLASLAGMGMEPPAPVVPRGGFKFELELLPRNPPPGGWGATGVASLGGLTSLLSVGGAPNEMLWSRTAHGEDLWATQV